MKRALFFILLVASLIRLVGLVPGHNTYHPDEPMSYSGATEMILNQDLNPRRFDYPAGVPILHYGLYKTFFLPIVLLKNYALHPGTFPSILFKSDTFFRQHSKEIFGPRELHALFWSRLITAMLGICTVYLAYVIGRKLFDKVAGLAAAFMVAVNYRHVLSSHLALSDIPNAFVAMLAFLGAALLWEKKTRSRYLLCGLLIGLSLSMKYQVFAFFPFLAAHMRWVVKTGSIKTLFSLDFLLGIGLVPMVFIILNPYLLLHLREVLPVIQMVSLRYGVSIWQFNAYALYYLFYWGIGKLPMLAILCGFILGALRRPWQTLLLFSFVGPFLFVFLYYMRGGIYVRNFTTVIPFLAVFAGFAFSQISFLVKRYVSTFGVSALMIFFAIVINAIPFYNSVTAALAYMKPWNRDQLTRWSQQNLPKGSRILNDNISLSGSHDQFMITPWGVGEGDSLTELMETAYDIAILNVSENQNNLFWHDDTFLEIITYRGLPVKSLQDRYAALRIGQYKAYTVFEYFKPWQAPDDSYFVIKIPQKTIHSQRIVEQFSFAKSTREWSVHNWSVRETTGDLFWFPDGYTSAGSLSWTGCIRQSYVCRISSPVLPAKQKTLYMIEAFARSVEPIDSNQRDGFLRVDFYTTSEDATINQPRTTAVSNRVFGNTWIKLSIVATAPPGAKYVTVGFQRSRVDSTLQYILDDVTIMEVEGELRDRFTQIPYIQPSIPDTILYPNGIY